MSKYFWGIFWIVFGCFIFIISSITDSLICSKESGYCIMQSRITFINKIVNEDKIPISEINKIQCIKTLQPSKSGKKSFYVLKLIKTNETTYNLGSYQKLAICNDESQPIKTFLQGKSDRVIFSSGLGFVNLLGYIFGVIMFIISIIVLTSNEEIIEEEDEEDDDDE